ncbi:MAG: Na+/H+ antiporter subunit E [Aggregatilineales bacterium]
MDKAVHKVAERESVRPSPLFSIFDLTLRGALFAGLWWVLNRGNIDSWILGIPVVILATSLSAFILPTKRWRIHVLGVILYVLYFLRKSVLSSIDVAMRVLRPEMPLRPGLLHYPLRLRQGYGRVIVANTTSLLPGTLCVDLKDDILIVHVLDKDAPVIEELRILEMRVAAIYGVKLSEDAT